jgi:transcriptional regulator with PAS, ATPase and Fis domain
MAEHPWFKDFPGSIIVCDAQGIILEMNAKANRNYEKDGGERLIGTNLLDCHPEPARSKVEDLLESQASNIYTIEKNGIHKLIYQTAWMEDGQYRGLVELSLEIPAEMPHFLRG